MILPLVFSFGVVAGIIPSPIFWLGTAMLVIIWSYFFRRTTEPAYAVAGGFIAYAYAHFAMNDLFFGWWMFVVGAAFHTLGICRSTQNSLDSAARARVAMLGAMCVMAVMFSPASNDPYMVGVGFITLWHSAEMITHNGA